MVDFLEFFNLFLCQWNNSQMLQRLYKMVSLTFTIISCVAATTQNFSLKDHFRLMYMNLRDIAEAKNETINLLKNINLTEKEKHKT